MQNRKSAAALRLRCVSSISCFMVLLSNSSFVSLVVVVITSVYEIYISSFLFSAHPNDLLHYMANNRKDLIMAAKCQWLKQRWSFTCTRVNDLDSWINITYENQNIFNLWEQIETSMSFMPYFFLKCGCVAPWDSELI